MSRVPPLVCMFLNAKRQAAEECAGEVMRGVGERHPEYSANTNCDPTKAIPPEVPRWRATVRKQAKLSLATDTTTRGSPFSRPFAERHSTSIPSVLN